MSTNNQKYPVVVSDGAPVPEEDLKALCKTYNIPEPIGKMFFCMIKGQLYVKLPLLLYKGHERGIQNIETERKKEGNEWVAIAKITPSMKTEVMLKVLGLPDDERKWWREYLTKPTIAIGRASAENVANSVMHKWLPEMAEKRALARALRLFASIGHTAIEETEDAEFTPGTEDEPIRLVQTNPEESKPVENRVGVIEKEDDRIIKDLERRGVIAPQIQEASTTSKQPVAVPAAAPPAAANPSPADQVSDECICGHAWHDHFAQRERVACFKCYKDKPKEFVCKITPKQLEEYKRLKPAVPAAK